jgi:quercetin dioxygenase-like cupin family protein
MVDIGETCMIERRYPFTISDEKHIEKIVDDDPVMINHIILPKGECVPDHRANSYVHMIVVRGTLTLQLEHQEPHHYPHGSIIHIPYETFMKVRNEQDDPVEFFVVKSPNPRVYGTR